MALAIADMERRYDLSSLRLCVSGGERLPAAIWEEWKARTGVTILDGIGATEVYHNFLCNPVDDVRPGSSGKPVPGYDARIVDEGDDDGVEVGTGEVGNLMIRGESIALSYWHQYERSRASFRGEWFFTGDKYKKDADGYYWNAGRSDDMLKVGGIWVSPMEVESVLISHEAVAECALDKEARAALRAKLQKQREAREKAAAGAEPKVAKVKKKGGPSFFSKMFGWMKRGKGKKAASAPPRRRRRSYGELVGIQGGLTALLFAAREGHVEAVEALLDAGADINQLSEGTKTSAILIATMNGRYDLAKLLLDRGADPSLANEPAGVTPLYAAINVWYAPHTSYPQPTAQFQQSLTHLELMKALLEGGADPNGRLKKKIWFSAYNFDQSGLDETGATPFWRAAYASDVAAMRLLKDHGADPSIRTKKPPERPRVADEQAREIKDISALPPVPEGGPAIAPIHAASGAGYGEGFAANEHRNHPAGFLAGVRFLVEACGANVNARDHEGNTALHNAAARGDVALIEYLVSKGADVTAVNREGQYHRGHGQRTGAAASSLSRKW